MLILKESYPQRQVFLSLETPKLPSSQELSKVPDFIAMDSFKMRYQHMSQY
jgi:hypothetical protein